MARQETPYDFWEAMDTAGMMLDFFSGAYIQAHEAVKKQKKVVKKPAPKEEKK
jgi:hypothetical protein